MSYSLCKRLYLDCYLGANITSGQVNSDNCGLWCICKPRQCNRKRINGCGASGFFYCIRVGASPQLTLNARGQITCAVPTVIVPQLSNNRRTFHDRFNGGNLTAELVPFATVNAHGDFIITVKSLLIPVLSKTCYVVAD
jgi:hypothetical protein